MDLTASALVTLLVLTPLAGCVAIDEPAPPEGPFPFDTIDKGQRSGIEDQRTVVIRDEPAWQALWAEHKDDGSFPADDTPEPNVDFDVQMVVAVFKGTSADACHSANITAIEGTGDGAVVVHGEWITGIEDRMCAEVVTYPYHLVRTSQTDAPVVFDMVETTASG